MNQEITNHLSEAFAHLEKAMQMSIQSITADKGTQKSIGQLWEQFLGKFFQMIRIKGKESKLNLLSLISFNKVMKG